MVGLYHCCFLPVLEGSRYFLTIHLGAWGPFLERPGKLSGPVVTGSFEKQAPDPFVSSIPLVHPCHCCDFLSVVLFPFCPHQCMVLISILFFLSSRVASTCFSFSLYPLSPVKRFPPIRKAKYFPLVFFKVFPPRFSPSMWFKVQHSAENFFTKIMWKQFFFLNHVSKPAVQSKFDAKVRKSLGNCSSKSFLSGIYQLLVLCPFSFGFQNCFLLARKTNRDF